MRFLAKALVPVAFSFIGFFTVNQVHPVPQIQTALAANITISTAGGFAGDHLVDGQGRSLYVFEKDPPKGSTCTDDCARLWPPLTAAESDTVGTSGSAQSSRLGTPYVRLDGTRQVVYADRALYYYQGDTQPGDTKGNNLDSFGGRWCLVSPAGAPLCQSGGSTPSSTPSAAPGTAPGSAPVSTPGTPFTPLPIFTSGPIPTAFPTQNPIPTQTVSPPQEPTTPPPPVCGPCTCTQPGQVNCLNACGNSFPC